MNKIAIWVTVLGIIIILGLSHKLAYDYGADMTRAGYISRLNEAYARFENERIELSTKTQDISKRYQDAQKQITVLYDDNLRLVERMREQERDNAKRVQTPASTGGAVKCAPCPAVSSAAARDHVPLARDADKAAEYAQKCYEYVKIINKPLLP